MSDEATRVGGWILNEFHASIALWVWGVVVLLYGFAWRSLNRPEPDEIRPSGPTG